MKQIIRVKVYDNTSTLDEQNQKILQVATMNIVAMTSALFVGSKGEGGEGVALNPVEDCFCGIELLYQKAIPDELAEECRASLERRLVNFYKMSDLDMNVELTIE
ncbi:hypothetical protein [Sporosarcina sp. OR05]|uniref:hypothetical protein n=1 Tax=Sporosarcina sp. OR05 TaxID=2969819 RepID=UPI00352A306B